MFRRFQKVALAAMARYPFLDPDSSQRNDEAIAHVIHLRNAYITRDGKTLAEALDMAVSKLAPTYESMVAFRVVRAEQPCKCCKQGGQWGVMGPDKTMEGITFDDEIDAYEYSVALNKAYDQGIEAATRLKS